MESFFMAARDLKHALDVVKPYATNRALGHNPNPNARWQFANGWCTVTAHNDYSVAKTQFKVPDMPENFSCELILPLFALPGGTKGAHWVSVDDTKMQIEIGGRGGPMLSLKGQSSGFRTNVDGVWEATTREPTDMSIGLNRTLLMDALSSIKPGKKNDVVQIDIRRGKSAVIISTPEAQTYQEGRLIMVSKLPQK